MANLRLKSNILELVCRICLKMHKERYNIFEHFENNRLPANMITELMCIQVLKEDSLPKTICSNCLGRLNDAYNLKLLATESSIKLRNFCRSKSVGNSLEDERNFSDPLEIKEEPEDVKIEENVIEEFHLKTLGKDKDESDINSLNDFSAINVENVNHFISMKNLDSARQEERESKVLNENEKQRSDSPNYLNTDYTPSDITSESSYSETESSSSEQEVTNDKNIENTDQVDAKSSKVNKKPANKFVKSKILGNEQIIKPYNRNGKFRCKLCGKSFSYNYYLVHIRQHAGNAPYKCDICGKCFVLKCILKQHKQSHAIDKRYSCDVCGKSFKILAGLKMHQFVHSEDRPFKCEVCGKLFKQETTLKVHVLRHDNIRPHVCEICGKAFTDQSGLRKHKATHNVEKSFTCSVCGKGFKSKIRLDCHQKVHSGIKSHACNQCGKRFGGTEQLKQHILIHTGAKPFACELCGKTFRQRSCLPRHMRIHTGETPFPCKICASTFKFSHHLQNHMKVHHKDVPQE